MSAIVVPFDRAQEKQRSVWDKKQKPVPVSKKILSNRQERAAELVKNLTVRELQVLHFMVDGLSSKEIARKLGKSYRTVEVHRYNALSRLGVRSSLAAVAIGAQAGLGECDYLWL